jgi:uncharacterized protein YlxW (UPF0749 family)
MSETQHNPELIRIIEERNKYQDQVFELKAEVAIAKKQVEAIENLMLNLSDKLNEEEMDNEKLRKIIALNGIEIF